METTITLQDPFSYSLVPIVLLLSVLIGSALVFLTLHLKKKKRRNTEKTAKQPENKPTVLLTREQVRKKYLKLADDLGKDYQSGAMSQRECYQNLSQCVRHFVSDMSGRDVTKMTLTELQLMGMPELKQLIEEYYEPEFAKESKADVTGAIARTKKVIEEWN